MSDRQFESEEMDRLDYELRTEGQIAALMNRQASYAPEIEKAWKRFERKRFQEGSRVGLTIRVRGETKKGEATISKIISAIGRVGLKDRTDLYVPPSMSIMEFMKSKPRSIRTKVSPNI